MIDQLSKDIKELLENLRFHISLEEHHLTYMDLMIHHNPRTVEDYKHIKNCISRELEYRKTQAAWRLARSSHGFRYSHYEKDEPLIFKLMDDGSLGYDENYVDEENGIYGVD